ncbi:mitochondrial import inner membrane translocase subunit Tim17/Tim22/Tim23 family protein [Tasmannia lanceolata]|uniref:mitochondrial import inner membrane translocase subunit Tim17/Tim22/Tim23 family protein n=1 Tax=Tasmannia lanceolata TaxID=3420 RepID=UPI0040635B78
MPFLSRSSFPFSSSSSLENPPSPPSPDDKSDVAVERRLREAEDRLREAIEELQRRQRYALGLQPPCDHPDDSCVANAIGNLCQSFLLSYGVRVGIGILLRAFKLVRRQSYSSLLDLKQLVSEKDLIVREEACRYGLLFGGFTGSYHALRCLLRKLRKKETPFNAILAGSVAGLSILALDDTSRRRTLALYLLARLAQCAYNSAKSKNKFHLWGSHWRHGDSLLFALACGQVMYAFVMRPETLPKSYQDFILKTGPVAEPVYRAVRNCCRGSPVDVVALSAYLSNTKGSSSIKLEEFPSIIPCSVIHPDSKSCLAHNSIAASATFRKTFPLYFSLTFVPFVVLHLQKFLESPALTFWLAVKGAVRSTSFLSAFVGIFQGVICLHRKVASKDHKLLYWLAGGMAALSVLLEKKGRRAELALYVFPRAADSTWYILVNRHLLPNIKNAEVALFCLCMGGIMYYLEHEPDTMAPLLRGLIRRFLASRISNPSPSSNRNASYSYLQTISALDKPQLPENHEREASQASETYNLDSIPGL